MKPYYELAGITIYHGDCRDILPQLPKFDMVLTDPPYGIGFASQPCKYQRASGMKPQSWDDARVELPEFNADVIVIWGGNYFTLPISRGWLSWHKPDAPPSMGNVELAWTNQDRNHRQISHSIAATNPERVGHPTQKPLAVMLWALGQFPHCKTILDPYMGIGTTLRAAKDLRLTAVGIEIEERYCEMAVLRLSQEVLAL